MGVWRPRYIETYRLGVCRPRYIETYYQFQKPFQLLLHVIFTVFLSSLISVVVVNNQNKLTDMTTRLKTTNSVGEPLNLI